MFQCGRNILNRLDVTYEQACMATLKDKYYTKLLENVIDYNYHHNAPFYNKDIWQAISKVIAETEEREAERNANNVTMDTFCQSPVTTKYTRKDLKRSK